MQWFALSPRNKKVPGLIPGVDWTNTVTPVSPSLYGCYLRFTSEEMCIS